MLKKKSGSVKSSNSGDYKAPSAAGEKPKYDASAIEKAAGATAAAAGGAPIDEFELLASKLPKEAQEKLRDIKVKLDKFKSAVLAKFDKYIMGIALLPPPMPQQGAGMFAPGQLPPTLQPQMPQIPQTAQLPHQQEAADADAGANASQQQLQLQQQQQIPPQDQVNILILVDDADSKKMTKDELKTKLSTIIQGMASEVDNKFIVQCIILSELWQNCYDGKYELTQVIASSAPVYDTGMLAAVRISEIHKQMVIKKFERYIVSYVLAGSLTQGRATEKSDIDVFIVVDDTDVKRMTRVELKDKLR
ncbi:MAG: nucleotidyltransferase domain-containing protein, partial [Nanoarchaeota archaeon]